MDVKRKLQWITGLMATITVAAVGCQNGVMGPTRIPAPATYSIGQNNYYNPAGAAATGSVVDPNGVAPTPAGTGWQPTGQGSSTRGANPPRSADNSNFSLSSNAAGNAASSNVSTGSQSVAAAQTSPSLSFQNDPSRVPVSDATGVRAPARYQNPYSNVPAQVAQTGFQNGSSGQYPPVNPTQAAPRTYIGNPQIVAGPVPYRGQPIYTRPNSNAPAVLAESTVRMDPNSRNYQTGWRDREPGSEIMR